MFATFVLLLLVGLGTGPPDPKAKAAAAERPGAQTKAQNPQNSPFRSSSQPEDYGYYGDWAEWSANFHPKSLLSLTVRAKSSEVFYESVAKQPTTIRGMFFTISKDEDATIAVTVKSPLSEFTLNSDEVMYQAEAPEGFFEIEARIVGDYQIQLANKHWSSAVDVTLAAGTDDHAVLTAEHVEDTFTRVRELQDHVDNIYAQYRYLWSHNNRQINATRQAQGKLLCYAVVQFSIILICSVLSLWYVKRSVSNKRIL